MVRIYTTPLECNRNIAFQVGYKRTFSVTEALIYKRERFTESCLGFDIGLRTCKTNSTGEKESESIRHNQQDYHSNCVRLSRPNEVERVMSVTAGLGCGEYLLLFPALIAWRAREHRHCVGNTRREVVVSTDPLSILNSLGRREQEALSRTYE